MPKLSVEIDIPIEVWLRANRATKSIASHMKKYVLKIHHPSKEWIILSTKEDGRLARTRDGSSLYLRYVYSSTLTVKDLADWIGYVGDNNQDYIFGVGKVRTRWGMENIIYRTVPTTHAKAFKKLLERLGAYLDYVNSELGQ